MAEKKSISTIKGELLPYLVQKQFAAPPAEDDPLSMAPEPLPELADLGLHASNVIGGASTKERIRCFALVLKPGDEVFAGRGNTNHMYSELNKQVPKRFATLWPTSDRSELARVHPTATVAERTNVGPDSIIGEGSRVGTYSSVKKSVVGAHTTIGNKCKIINCVIMSHATIMDGSTLTNCIVCPNGYISEEANLTNCQVGNSHTVPRGGRPRGGSRATWSLATPPAIACAAMVAPGQQSSAVAAGTRVGIVDRICRAAALRVALAVRPPLLKPDAMFVVLQPSRRTRLSSKRTTFCEITLSAWRRRGLREQCQWRKGCRGAPPGKPTRHPSRAAWAGSVTFWYWMSTHCCRVWKAAPSVRLSFSLLSTNRVTDVSVG